MATKRGSGGGRQPGWSVILKQQEAATKALKDAADAMKSMASQQNANPANQMNLGNLTASIINGMQFVMNNQNPGTNPLPRPPGPGPNTQANPTVGGGRMIGSPTTNFGGGHSGFAGFRHQLAGAMHDRYGSASGSSFRSQFDPTTGAHVGYQEYDQFGNKMGFHDVKNPATKGLVEAAAKRGTVSSLAGGLSSGGVMGAARALPAVGGAIVAGEAVYQGAQWVGDQRAKNAQYQAIYGGSNLEGLRNRMSGKGFELGQLFTGGLTQQMSQQAFQGVSSLGLGGSDRSNALNMISTEYKKLGVSVQESLDLVSLSAKTFNQDLSGLKDGLESVTKTARESGQSAVGLRQQFTQNYASFAQNNSAGGSVSAMASSVTNYIGSLGQSVGQYTNTSGMFNQAQMQKMASANHMTYSQFVGNVGSNRDLAIDSAGTMLKQVADTVFTPQQKQTIATMAKGQKPGPPLYRGIAEALLKSDQGNLGYQAPNLLQSRAGIQVSDAVSAVMILVKVMVEGTLSSVDTDAADQRKVTSSMDNVTKNNLQAAQMTAAGKDPSGGNNVPTAAQVSAAKQQVADIQQQNPNNVSDPVVDAALAKFKGRNVIVQAKQGKVVVNIATAAAKFRDQVAMGTAVLADTGETIKDALSGMSESNYYTSGGKDTKGDSAHVVTGNVRGNINNGNAVALDDYTSKTGTNAPAAAGGGGSNVTISMSADLQRWFSVNVDPVGSAAANGTPTNANTLPGTN